MDAGPEPDLARGDLEQAILDLLRPRGLRQRLRPPERTVRQLWEALPEGLRPAVEGAGLVAEQRSLDALREVLAGLVTQGRLRRRTEQRRVFLNTKGKRLVLVDLYRLG